MLKGYAVYRHADEARGRVTALVDFVADPDDRTAFPALLSAVEAEARKAGSDKIRAFVMNGAFRNTMRSCGYAQVPSTIEFVAKVNAVQVGPDFYADTSALARHLWRFGPGPLMPYLTIGIDTESDNQWVTEARLNPTYRKYLRAPPPARAFPARRSPTDVPGDPSGRHRIPIGRDHSAACGFG